VVRIGRQEEWGLEPTHTCCAVVCHWRGCNVFCEMWKASEQCLAWLALRADQRRTANTYLVHESFDRSPNMSLICDEARDRYEPDSLDNDLQTAHDCPWLAGERREGPPEQNLELCERHA